MERPEYRKCLPITIQPGDDPWAVLVDLVSKLGEQIAHQPPAYQEQWKRGGYGALSYSIQVAELVCLLWRILFKKPGLHNNRTIPTGLAPVLDTLSDLASKWVVRWKISLQAETAHGIWSLRKPAGTGDYIEAGGSKVDTGAPFVDVSTFEMKELRYAFEGLKRHLRQRSADGEPTPSDSPASVIQTSPPEPIAAIPKVASNGKTSHQPLAVTEKKTQQYLNKHPSAAIEEVRRAVKASKGSVQKTEAWKAAMAKRPQGRKAKQVRESEGILAFAQSREPEPGGEDSSDEDPVGSRKLCLGDIERDFEMYEREYLKHTTCAEETDYKDMSRSDKMSQLYAWKLTKAR